MTGLGEDGGSVRRKNRIGCLVLAAGAGERFDGIKQLADLGGKPLLEYALATARAVEAGRRIVVLGANADAILDRVDLLGIEAVRSGHWRDGQSASLRTGIRALSDLEAAVILLGDQPLVTTAAVDRLLHHRTGRDQAIRASYGGRPGHPVIVERSLFSSIDRLTGDQGARDLLERARTLEVPCDDIADPFDIDVESDLIEARARLKAPQRVDRT
jgi:nicotine blue oxidoreductase